MPALRHITQNTTSITCLKLRGSPASPDADGPSSFAPLTEVLDRRARKRAASALSLSASARKRSSSFRRQSVLAGFFAAVAAAAAAVCANPSPGVSVRGDDRDRDVSGKGGSARSFALHQPMNEGGGDEGERVLKEPSALHSKSTSIAFCNTHFSTTSPRTFHNLKTRPAPDLRQRCVRSLPSPQHMYSAGKKTA